MYKRILVPLDGSQRAERALPVAARIARASQGTVVLLQVVNISMQYGSPLAPTTYSPEMLDTEETGARDYLTVMAQSDTLAGVPTEIQVETGSPALAILDAATSRHADLIVISSHGRTGLARWVLGSVAHHVVRQSPVPVFVLREHGPSPAEPHPDTEHLFRVLVPLDGSTLAEVALEPAVQLAAALTAPAEGALHLVLVLLPYEADADYMPEALAMRGAKSYLSGIVERLRAEHPGLHVTWTVTAQLDVTAAILRVAEQGDDTEGAGVFGGCDVIAMATHGYGGLKRWMIGSITERVLQAAKLPLLIVRPPEVPGGK